MARDTSELTDAQWEKIALLLPEPKASPWGGPKPIPNWPCFEGMTIAVLWQGRGRPRKRPERLIYDKACASDALCLRLAKRGIDLICPHRKNRTKPLLQDGRKLRRYKRRWKVERTFAWLGNFRRLVVRWERSLKMYRAFFHVACLVITL